MDAPRLIQVEICDTTAARRPLSTDLLRSHLQVKRYAF